MRLDPAAARLVRQTAALESTATPTAPPIWNAAVLIPDATPEWRSDTPDSAAIWPATVPAPSPTPKITKPGSVSTT